MLSRLRGRTPVGIERETCGNGYAVRAAAQTRGGAYRWVALGCRPLNPGKVPIRMYLDSMLMRPALADSLTKGRIVCCRPDRACLGPEYEEARLFFGFAGKSPAGCLR